MFRKGIVPLSLALIAGFGLVSCSSTTSTPTSTTGAGVSVTTTTAKPAGSTPAGTGAVAVSLTDKSGLNGPMIMSVAPATTKAGKVTFAVTNAGTITHEVVVLKLKSGESFDKLIVTDDKVGEEGKAGEVEVEAGQSGTFDVDLTAGKYALVCNVEKHYGKGMIAELTVT